MVLGLGSMVGTGVFQGIGLAAGPAGGLLLPAIVAAGALAWCNAHTSARLASAYPVSGGAYEYGYQLLTPTLGFAAGWMFLVAKCASAATAAMVAGRLVCGGLGIGGVFGARLVSVAALLLCLLLTLAGVRRSNRATALLLAIIVSALAAFVGAAIGADFPPPTLSPAPVSAGDFAAAVALVFVAFTGYGRLATLGEEVREPARTIPRAIHLTMLTTVVLYLGVAWAAGRLAGPQYAMLAQEHALPLGRIAEGHGWMPLARLVDAAGVLALLGVTMNLLLGLSRMALAMARRGDLPIYLTMLNDSRTSPIRALWFVALLIAIVIGTRDLMGAWSLSATTVLIYYGINNAAGFRLARTQGGWGWMWPLAGMAGCLLVISLAGVGNLLLGLGLLAVGLAGRAILRR